MKSLLIFKKYLPQILYTVLGIVVLFILYKLFIRVRSTANTVGGAVADIAETQVLSDKTGVSISKIKLLRQDSQDLAHDLNTLKTMSFWDRATNLHIQFDADTLKRFKNVTSENEMIVFKNLYENEYTDKHSLVSDLRDTLSGDNLQKVPFIYSIY